MPPKGERKKSASSITKSALASELSEKAGITKAQAVAVLGALYDITKREIKSTGKLVIPDIVRIQVKHKAARAAREGRNPATGETIMIKAQPAGKTVKAYAVKALKELV